MSTQTKFKHTAMCVLIVLLAAAWLWGTVLIHWSINREAVGPVPTGIGDLLRYWSDWSGERRFTLTERLMGAAVAIALISIGFEVYRDRRSLHGDARFATRREIQKAGLYAKQGILVGRAYGRYLVAAMQAFVLLAAPTRSGKGVGLVIPNLLNWVQSVVSMDVKLELWRTTSGYRKSVLRQATYLFSPFAVDLASHRWNPLDEVSKDPVRRPGDVLMIAQIFYPERPGDKNIFFVQQAQNLFFGLTLYLLESKHPQASLGEVARQGAGYDKPLREHLLEILEKNPDLSRQCKDALRKSLSQPDETFGNIKASFDAPLLMFSNPTVDAATAASDFSLQDLRRQRMSVYFGITPDRLDISSKLINLFFTMAITLNTGVLPEDDKTLKYECLLVLDEFTAFGRVAVLAKAVSFVAGYGLRLLTIVQSKSQLEGDGLYSRADARNLIVNHDIKVVFTPGDDTEAKDASEMLGTYTEKATARSSNRNTSMLVTSSSNAGENISDTKRQLMMPQELKRMSLDKEIIDKKGARPVFAEKIRFYDDAIFVDRLKMVSPSLSALGKRIPTRDELDAARIAGELAAPVPSLPLDGFIKGATSQGEPSTLAKDRLESSEAATDGGSGGYGGQALTQLMAQASRLASDISDWSAFATGDDYKNHVLKTFLMQDFMKSNKGGPKHAGL